MMFVLTQERNSGRRENVNTTHGLFNDFFYNLSRKTLDQSSKRVKHFRSWKTSYFQFQHNELPNTNRKKNLTPFVSWHTVRKSSI